MVRLFAKKRQPNPVGRPALLSPAKIDKAQKTMAELVAKADGRYKVTAGMIKRKARVKVNARRNGRSGPGGGWGVRKSYFLPSAYGAKYKNP